MSRLALTTRSGLLLIVPTLLCASGCDDLTTPYEGPSDFSGIVVQVGDQASSLLIERTSGDSAVVHVSSHTWVYPRLPDGTNGVNWNRRKRLDWDSVTHGDSIEVWTTGTELRSDPPQYYAVCLVVW